MGVIVSGIRYQGRLFFSTLSGFGGSSLEFITKTGNISTQLDGVALSYPLVTNALPGEQLTYMVSAGTLPSGISLDILTGVISGTPASVSDTTTYFFTVLATKVGGAKTSRTFNITVNPNPQPEFAPSVVDENGKALRLTEDGYEVVEFKPFVAYTNGITPKPGLTYAVTQGSLPTGLTLNSDTGVISGTPPLVATPYQRAVQITLSSGTKVANTNLSFAVKKNRAPAFSTPTYLGEALGGGYFQAQIVATDGDGEDTTITLSEGSSLPTGLTFVDGVISGNLPLATDADTTHTFSMDVTDGHSVVFKQFEITALLNVNPVFTSAPGYDVLTGAPQSRKIEAIDPNAASEIVLTRKSSNLPPEVTFDEETGDLIGTFVTPGSYNLVVEASNGELVTEQTFTFYVAENLAPVWVTPAGLLGNAIGQNPTEFLLEATDANGTPVTYSVVGGSLPSGLSLSRNRIVGLADQVVAPGVTSTFTIRASDGLLHSDRQFSIYVDRNDNPVWNTPVSLGVAYEGTLFTSQPLSAYDPDGQTVRLSPTQNGLPVGWTFDTTTNVVSGTMPSVSKNAITSFTVFAHDGSPTMGTGTTGRRFEITNLFNKMPVWTTDTLPKGVERDTYDFFFLAENPGNAGFIFTLVSGTLPSGLTLTSAGRLSGTIAPSGQDEIFTFTVRVANEIGFVEREFTLLVEYNLAPIWLTAEGNLLTTLANNALSVNLAGFDANGTPLTYTAVTPLPAGLSLSAVGVITGKTAITQTENVAEFTLALSDNVFSIERTFSITTLADSDPIWTTDADLGNILEGQSVQITLTASDPERSPLTYTLKSGTLPSGMTFDAAQHRLSGTAPEVTEDTTYNFEIEVSDGVHTMSRNFTLTVENNVAPVWTTPAGNIGSFRSGEGLSFIFEATDANGTSVGYSLLSGTLPQGVSFINGTLATGQNGTSIVLVDTDYTFTVRASDGRFFTDRTFTVTLTKNEPPVWISEGLLFEGDEGESFSVELEWMDPEGDLVSFVGEPSIPGGDRLTIDGTTLSGTLPTVNQTTVHDISLAITDGQTTISRTFQLKTNFSSAPKWVSATSLATNRREGTAFNMQLQSYAGPAGATYVSKGAMPGSLQVSSTGAIQGNLPLIDVMNQTVSFTVTATNAFGSTDRTFTIGVVNNIEPVWSRPSGFVHIGKENSAINTVVSATDADDATLTYTVVSGALPTGVNLNASTGALTGTLPVVEEDTVYDFVLGVADNSVRVDRAYKIRAQNVMAFSINDLTGIASPTTAQMIVDGQIAGEWSSYKGLADRTITVTPPASATYDHGRNIPNFTYTFNNLTGADRPPTAIVNVNIADNPIYMSSQVSLNTTTNPGTSASMTTNATDNAVFTSSTVTPTTTAVAASSATQNT